MDYTMRLATEADAAAILDVYRPYVENTTVTFEYEVPTIEAFQARMRGIMAYYPYLVCERDGALVGYAYASRYRERAAYGWDAELSVYLREDAQHSGLAGRMYDALIEILRAQGFVNVYGIITHPNEKSEQFHAKQGFVTCGIAHRTGWKFGQWIDVADMERRIAEPAGAPEPTRSIHDMDPALIERALRGEAE